MKGTATKKDKRKRYNPLMPILLATRVTGFTPFTLDNYGNLQWKINSLSFYWALFLLPTLSASVIHFYFLKTKYDWSDYNFSLIKLREMAYVVMLVQPVLTVWATMPDFVNAVNKWNDLNNVLTSISKNYNQKKMHDISKCGVAAVFLCTIMIVAYSGWNDYTLSHITIRLLLLTIAFNTLIICHMWNVMTRMLKNAFDTMNDELFKMTRTAVHKNVLIEVCPAPDAGRLSDRRRLWLAFHSVAADLTRALDKVIGSWLLETLFFICTLLYACLKTDRVSRRNVRFFGNSCIFATMIFSIFRFSHSAQDSITYNIVTTLFYFRNTALSERARDEVELFISTVEMSKPCFDVLGVIKFDKKEFLNLVITINTYVVVLLQFDQIIERNEHQKT